MLCKNLLNIKEPNQYTIKDSSIASFYIVQLIYDITNKNTFKTRLKNRHRLLDGENIEPNIGRGRNHQFRDSEKRKKSHNRAFLGALRMRDGESSEVFKKRKKTHHDLDDIDINVSIN